MTRRNWADSHIPERFPDPEFRNLVVAFRDRSIDHEGLTVLALDNRSEPAMVRLDEFEELPYAVGKLGEGKLIARFDTETHASQFIELLPDYLKGIYFIDGPPE